MPRDLDRSLFRILNNEEFKAVEFLDIRLAGGTDASTIHLTNAGQEVTFDGDVYKPINFSRSRYQELLATESGEVPRLTVAITNVDGQMAALLNRAELEGATATLWMTDRRALDKRFQVTKGEVKAPSLTGGTLVLEIVNIIGLMEATYMPRRMLQRGCNATFGSASCGADLSASPNTIEATVLSGTTDRAIVVGAAVLTEAGNPTDPNDFWVNGYVVVADGQAACQARPFARYAVGPDALRRFYVAQQFLIAPAPGDTVKIRRGCPKTVPACVERQGDELNYQGFTTVPYPNERPRRIRGY